MESYDQKSDEAASEAEKLAEEGERVDKHIDETKSDWEAKQGDSSVPGAVPAPDEADEELMRAESESGESPDGADE